MPVDRTDDLTEYEFEYEYLLEEAYNEWIADSINKQKVNLSDGSIDRTFSMDPDEYEYIRELAEQGEYVDFEIPKDAPMGKRASEKVLGLDQEEEAPQGEQVPVDLNEIFGANKGHI